MRRAARRGKYNARKTTVANIVFASAKEARRYQELKLLEKAGEITGLELQPRFMLTVKGVKIGEYRGDFRFRERIDGQWFWTVEDTKGFRTPLYRWQAKHVLAEHGVEIHEA